MVEPDRRGAVRGVPDGVGPGLRVKVTASFAAIALTLSVALGVSTFLVVRQALLAEVEEGTLEQAVSDARLVSAALRSDTRSEAEILASLRPALRSRPFLYRDGEWYSASLRIRSADLPPDLVETVLDGEAARQRFAIGGSPYLAVGIPLELGAYVEVSDLGSVDSTLATLGRTLAAAGAATTAAGALLGWWLARRVLRPVEEVTQVAEDIASGDLSARLDESLDEDLARLSASFNSMATSLQRRIDREARFASDVSHELRSPLTTVLTSLSVLERRRSELSPEAAEAVDLLGADVRRFHRMVLDLIEISQHDAGRATAILEERPVGELVRGTLRRLGHADLPLEVSPDLLGTVVAADERRIERVLANLIDNARVHGGGVTRVCVEPGGLGVRVAVEDAGPGIPPDERETAFDRFARGRRARERADRDGAGLGLALAQENAHLHGGRVTIEDAADGARVVLELPVVRR